MKALQQRCRPKHQVLVLKCYPRTTKGAVDVKPNSSELSYLLFYATSRRSKIQKIGAFLEKKTASDVWRLRIGNVQVTLQILAALIEKAPKDLPLFATNVLKILDLVLDSKDITMAQSSIPTFEAFCANHDVSSSFADQDYLTQYESVVRHYATLASTRHVPSRDTVSKPVQTRWRMVGLEAIRSVSSADPLASVAGRQLSVIVPIILENLWREDDDEFLNELLARAEMEEKADPDNNNLHRRKTSVATVRTAEAQGGDADPDPLALAGTALDVDKLDEEGVSVLALRCLKQIFVVPNQSQIHAATLAMLRFIQERVTQGEAAVKRDPATGEDGGWAITLLAMVAHWAPVQDRYVILVTAMDHLLGTPVTEGNLQQHMALAAMISSLLRSDVNLIGLSVMDVLLGLIQHIKRVLHLPGSVDPTELLDLLGQCIGHLATHVYYADQISDMISAILFRLRPSRAASGSANSSPRGEKADASQNDDGAANLESYLTLSTGKITALKAIKSILLVTNPRTRVSGNLNLTRNRVGISAWEGTHWLLRDPDGQVRKAYVDALLTWLDGETTEADRRVRRDEHALLQRSPQQYQQYQPPSPGRRIPSNASFRERSMQRSRSHFLQLLHLCVYDNALQYVDSEPDLVLLHVLLAQLVAKLGVNAVRYGLPMIFRLQEDIQEVETPLQKVRIGSLCHGYFWAVIESFDIEASVAGRAIQNEIIRRRSKKFWVEGIRLPLPALDLIDLPGNSGSQSRPQPQLQSQPQLPMEELETEALLPFDDRISLVECIAASYADGPSSPTISPAASPGRSFSQPILGSVLGAVPAERYNSRELPDTVRELMLAEWTRDTAILAIQSASKPGSLAGSRAATTATGRNRVGMNGASANGNGYPMASSPLGSQQNLQGGLASFHKTRQASLRSGRSASPSPSSRGPVASVEQLKMVLSGQIPRTSAGTTSGGIGRRFGHETHHDDDSGSDSMVSFDYSPSELSFHNAATPGAASPRPENEEAQQQHLHLRRTMSHGRKGGPLSSNPAAYDEAQPLPRGNGVEDDDVPPVPPLPLDVSTLSGHVGGEALRPGRPATAPHGLKPARRNVSSRSADGRFRTPLRDDAAAETVDLRDLLLAIDSGASDQGLGNMTRPPY
ncbi:hypothetical protein ACRALDRAFT_1047737 [Sodiomyces alcalophilus JCM 7366]|uniref:uncharacterized protein n=1 Tax=Sodiomyces alcalophilus JCM 7366 TaxID=591952 RepID=UPI0039B375CE